MGIKRFLKDERGATSIEYALIAVMIAVVIVSAVGILGTNLKAKYLMIGNAVH